jgi:hypothetical protein
MSFLIWQRRFPSRVSVGFASDGAENDSLIALHIRAQIVAAQYLARS